MDIHYNAFISYRHHPEDIRVATEIHRALERYRIPKAVRKNLKGNLRLFRDKDELPITSSLTDDITRALENSDFLIVICSTHTQESIWVKREIETFLRTHTYDRVLTVLVDGEPYDTIPENLQYREEVDPDTGSVERVMIEPLSCDWRVPKKKAYREELPRLAAALLHCGYDELRQRQRQYKMRRLVTFFSLALAASMGLMAYFLYTSIKIQQANDRLQAANEEIREANIQIQNNLDEALRNQSEYLASAAGELYEDGDRLRAISLAMAALPSQGNQRPYVADAERVLTEVLGLYTSNNDIAVAAGTYDTGVTVSQFALSSDGKVIYLQDRNSRVTCWDTETYEQLGAFQLSDTYVWEMDMVGHNLVFRVMVDYGSDAPELLCYAPDGTQLWTVATCKDYAILDEDTVLVLESSYGATSVLRFFDAASGKERRSSVELRGMEAYTIYGIHQDSYVTGQPVLIDASIWTGSYSARVVFAADMEGGTATALEPFSLWEAELREELEVVTGAVTDQGDILVVVSDDSGTLNGEFYGMITTSPNNDTILCYDAETFALKWQVPVTSYTHPGNITMKNIPGTSRILYQTGNVFLVLDSETGAVISRCESAANVLSMKLGENIAVGLLDNGYFFNYNYQENSCYSKPVADVAPVQGETQGAYYMLENLKTYVTKYVPPEGNSWQPIGGEIGELEIAENLLDGNYMAVLTYDDRIVVMDTSSRTIISSAPCEDRWATSILGFSQDRTQLYLDNGSDALVMDVATGAVKRLSKELEIKNTEASARGFPYMVEDKLYYLLAEGNNLHLAELYLKTGDVVTKLFAENLEGYSWQIGEDSGIAAASGEYAWLWHEGTLYEFSSRGRSFRVLQEGLSYYPVCQYHPEENLLSVCLEGNTLFYTPGGSQTLCIEHPGYRNFCIKLHQDTVFAINGEGAMLRYDQEGKRLSETALYLYTTFYSFTNSEGGYEMDIHWVFAEDGRLILDMFDRGNVIDCSQWRVRAYVDNFRAYDASTETFLCTSNSVLGYCPVYTTEGLLQLAQEQLNGYELSEEDRVFYGLD